MKVFYEYHLNKYPLIQKEDKIKLIYQGTLGPNHLGKDLLVEDVKKRLEKELLEESNLVENIYEWISCGFIRININQYIKDDHSLEELANSFVVSSKEIPYDIGVLKQELTNYLTEEELQNYNFKPISHSSIYRQKYLPHYLVVKKDYLTLDLRVKQLDNFLYQAKDYSITALEGKCTAGKSTICEALNDKYTIIHIDDFFLSKEQKTNKRLEEIGGNINYELVKENLVKIKKAFETNQKQVLIRCFDCQKQTYYHKEIILKNKVILEGVYSYHPHFNEYIDYLGYIYIDEKTQMQRVEQRRMKERFINEWIPLENKYFNFYKLENICNILI